MIGFRVKRLGFRVLGLRGPCASRARAGGGRHRADLKPVAKEFWLYGLNPRPQALDPEPLLKPSNPSKQNHLKL